MKRPTKFQNVFIPAIAETPDAAFAHLRLVASAQSFTGVVIASPIEDEFRLADRADSYISCKKGDVLFLEPRAHGLVEVLISERAQIWRTTKVAGSAAEDRLFGLTVGRVDEENIPQPLSIRTLADPMEGTSADQALLTAGATIEGAAKEFSRSCEGGGVRPNNCAHFLSDAFIRAGFPDFNASHDCVEIRCGAGELNAVICDMPQGKPYRVIRAKNLRCWFKKKATTTASTVQKNTGFWATYQERQSDGQGHVAIIDTGKWLFYATGWYSGWTQEYYKW